MVKTRSDRKTGSTAFLLAQVGAQAAALFAGRLAPHQLTPADAGILRLLARSPGLSQQELAKRLRMHASRLVAVVDELERKALIERQSSPGDRRIYALHLTELGKKALKLISDLAVEHQKALCAPLSDRETELLGELLLRIAQQQGLEPNVHPGYARLLNGA